MIVFMKGFFMKDYTAKMDNSNYQYISEDGELMVSILVDIYDGEEFFTSVWVNNEEPYAKSVQGCLGKGDTFHWEK